MKIGDTVRIKTKEELEEANVYWKKVANYKE